jgi:two-component SAPR family response regulator
VGKLTLNLLGPPEVSHDGRRVRFRARKALALLAYLAAEGSRGEITALLWPASDERRDRTALRSVLSSLRGTLEEAATSSAGWLERLLTHPVKGLNNYEEMIRLLTEEKGAIKVFVEVNSRV